MFFGLILYFRFIFHFWLVLCFGTVFLLAWILFHVYLFFIWRLLWSSFTLLTIFIFIFVFVVFSLGLSTLVSWFLIFLFFFFFCLFPLGLRFRLLLNFDSFSIILDEFRFVFRGRWLCNWVRLFVINNFKDALFLSLSFFFFLFP